MHEILYVSGCGGGGMMVVCGWGGGCDLSGPCHHSLLVKWAGYM